MFGDDRLPSILNDPDVKLILEKQMPNIDDDLAPHIPTRADGDDTLPADAGDDTLASSVPDLDDPDSLDSIEDDWEGDDFDDEDEGTDSDEWEEPEEGFEDPFAEEDDPSATEELGDFDPTA